MKIFAQVFIRAMIYEHRVEKGGNTIILQRVKDFMKMYASNDAFWPRIFNKTLEQGGNIQVIIFIYEMELNAKRKSKLYIVSV